MPSVLDLKDEVRARDGFRCTVCGIANEQHLASNGRQLEVHRREPDSPYTVAGCVTLCHRCHSSQPNRNGEKVRGALVSVRVPESVAAALENMAKANRRTRTQEIMIAIEDRLKAEGYWPGEQSGQAGAGGEGGE